MRRNNIIWCIGLLLAGMFVIGCTDGDTATSGITLSTGNTAEVYSVTNQSSEVKFEASGKWRASCNASWLTFSPKNGEAGSNVITVSTTATNRTKNSRNAQLMIESEGKTKTVTIKQRGDYAIFDRDELNVPSNGAKLNLRFKSNLPGDDLSIYATQGLEEWIKVGKNSSRTREEYEYSINDIEILANTSKDPRDGAFFIVMKDMSGNILPLDTLFVFQEGSDNGYHSIDYSQNGKVELINTATIGKGIPIVVMGDGFVDEEIADGSYSKTMKQAMENLFSEEPIKSLREYFNVYQVTVVSDRNRFDGVSSTVFGTVPDHQTMGIEVNTDSVMKYVKKVEGIDSVNTLAVVIMNTTINKGVTYMMGSNKQDYNYAIALCPVIDSLKSEMFRSVLVHEAIGHGFAKLADEYVRSTEGSATDADIKRLKELHEKWNWFMNVDSEKDSTKVIWSKFIYDNEYANEKIGTYEGGYTFYKGVYRPSEESMMRSNDAPFNAPSRQTIYNKVMKMGLGKTPTYEEFVEFDKAHKPINWSYRLRTRQSRVDYRRPAPPRIIWR